MFDVGFSEILVIMLVALVVIGPERLPKVARTLGHLWGRGQRFVNSIKQDINSSVELEELRKVQSAVRSEADVLQRAMQQTSSDIDQKTRQLECDLAESSIEVKPIKKE
jgi:sec-independent protein translocase protein TatB